MIKKLFWKEWREQRLFFFLAIGIIILSRIVPVFFPKGIFMSDDAEKRILAAIEGLKQDVESVREDVKNVREDVKNVREDNTIAHKGFVAMIEAVQKTQEEHTRRFDKIDEIHKAMSMTVNGERTHVMKSLAKDVEMIKTHLSL